MNVTVEAKAMADARGFSHLNHISFALAMAIAEP